MSPALSRVPPGLVDFVWKPLLPKIERGLARGQGDSFTSAQMREAILRGDMELWVVHEGDVVVAAIVICVDRYPNKQTLLVALAAGRDIPRWIDLVSRHLAEYRGRTGSDTLEAACRPGMAKFLEQNGWRKKAVIMEYPK